MFSIKSHIKNRQKTTFSKIWSRKIQIIPLKHIYFYQTVQFTVFIEFSNYRESRLMFLSVIQPNLFIFVQMVEGLIYGGLIYRGLTVFSFLGIAVIIAL